jgi:hypothetical protein
MLLLLAVVSVAAIAGANWLYSGWQARHPKRNAWQHVKRPARAADGTDPPEVGWQWLRFLVGLGLLGLMVSAGKEMEENGITVDLVFALGLSGIAMWVVMADLPGDDS